LLNVAPDTPGFAPVFNTSAALGRGWETPGGAAERFVAMRRECGGGNDGDGFDNGASTLTHVI
jgi:hypothetical protein